MALPPSGPTANANSNSDITALQAIANIQFISQSAQAIDNAIAQGLFFVTLTTFKNCSLVNLMNYYQGLGYQLAFPDLHRQVAGENAPFSCWGVDYYQWLSNSLVNQQVQNPVRMRIQWPLPTNQGFAGPSISTQIANYTILQNNEVVYGDTTAASFTVSLPASPADGWVESISKISTDTNTLTISGNGNNINGSPASLTAVSENRSYTLIFHAGYGWATFP